MNVGLWLNIWFYLVVQFFSLFVCCMKFSLIFLLVQEFGPGVRIFKKFAGVRIRKLVYEKNLWCTNLILVCEFSKKFAGVRIRTLVYEKKTLALSGVEL